MTFCRAKARTLGSLDVNAPSLKTGCVKRLVVAIAQTTPLSVKRLLELGDDLVPLLRRRAKGNEVVVVQVDAIGAEVAEFADALDGWDGGADGSAEGVCAGVADGPQAKREFVGLLRGIRGRAAHGFARSPLAITKCSGYCNGGVHLNLALFLPKPALQLLREPMEPGLLLN